MIHFLKHRPSSQHAKDANQSALREGSEIGKSPPKVVRRGCKRSLDPRRKGLSRVSCTMCNPVLYRYNPRLHWCKRLFAPSVQKTFCTRDLAFFDPSPRRSGLQAKDIIRKPKSKHQYRAKRFPGKHLRGSLVFMSFAAFFP